MYYGAIIVFVLFGMMVPKTISFPGLIALVPVLCAATFIAAGARLDARFTPYRLLSSKPMQAMGELSFTIYLWHWPLLILYQHQLQTTKLGLPAGLSVILLAVGLAWITNRLVERPSLHWLRGLSPARTLAICAAGTLVLAGAAIALRQNMIKQARQPQQVASLPAGTDHLTEDMVSIRPDLRHFIMSNYDRPAAINSCLGGRPCEYGDLNSDTVVALVGASHAAQWQPVFDIAGKKLGFKVVTILSTNKTFDLIEALGPDLVVTTSSLTSHLSIKTTDEPPQETVSDHVGDLFPFLEKRNIPVLAIRDNPRFVEYQNSCVWSNPTDQLGCALDRSSIFQPISPLPEAEYNNVYPVDLTDLFCLPEKCPAVVNGILVYYDRHHFSKSFMLHIAEAATTEILRQAPDLAILKQKGPSQ